MSPAPRLADCGPVVTHSVCVLVTDTATGPQGLVEVIQEVDCGQSCLTQTFEDTFHPLGGWGCGLSHLLMPAHGGPLLGNSPLAPSATTGVTTV